MKALLTVDNRIFEFTVRAKEVVKIELWDIVVVEQGVGRNSCRFSDGPNTRFPLALRFVVYYVLLEIIRTPIVIGFGSAFHLLFSASKDLFPQSRDSE